MKFSGYGVLGAYLGSLLSLSILLHLVGLKTESGDASLLLFLAFLNAVSIPLSLGVAVFLALPRLAAASPLKQVTITTTGAAVLCLIFSAPSAIPSAQIALDVAASGALVGCLTALGFAIGKSNFGRLMAVDSSS